MRAIASILRRLPQYLWLAWRLLWDPAAPLRGKLFLVGAVLYGILPFDLIPEGILPHIGFSEDLVLVVLAVRHLIKSTPEEVVKKHGIEIASRSRGRIRT